MPSFPSLQHILSASNDTVFADVAEFCQQTAPGAQSTRAVQAFAGEVPTALLLTGINTPDHDPVFASLVGRLKVVYFIDLLCIVDCSAN